MTIVQGTGEEFPFKVVCGRPNCYYSVLMPTLAEARRWDDPKEHKCPRGVDTMIGASLTHSLLEQSWMALDEIVNKIKAYPKGTPGDLKDPALIRLEGEGVGMARMLAIFMVPHFRTQQEISREALRRWQCRQSNEEVSTPGIAALKYTFPNDAKYQRMEAREAETKARREKGVDLPAEKKNNIIMLQGTFTAEQINKQLYPDVSVATIERLWRES